MRQLTIRDSAGKAGAWTCPLCLLGAFLAAGCASREGREYRGFESAPGPAERATRARPEPTKMALSPQPAPSALSRSTIEFFEFYTYGSGAPVPRPKLMGLSGKKVTLVGYMAQMESPPRGGFYLAPYPAVCGGSGVRGGGLPPPSVLVLSPAARGRNVDFVEGALEVTGILHVGEKASPDADGAAVRLILEDPRAFTRANTRSSERAPRPRGKRAMTALASSAEPRA